MTCPAKKDVPRLRSRDRGELSRLFIYNNSNYQEGPAAVAPLLITEGVPSQDMLFNSPSTASLGVLPEAPDEPLKRVLFNHIFSSEGHTIRMQTSQFHVPLHLRESSLGMYPRFDSVNVLVSG